MMRTQTPPAKAWRSADGERGRDDLTWTPGAFRRRYHAMVWSNSQAPDVVWIRRCLVTPLLDRMVDAVAAFGLDQLEEQWAILLADADPEALRAKHITERMLRNARIGCPRAST